MKIFLILLFAFLIRLVSLNQSLWLDEGTTALVSQMSLSEILNKFLTNDFHPPVYYLFIKYWSLIFGYSETSLRFPSIIFSLGTIYLIYLLWQDLVGKRNSWIAPILLSTSGLFIYYSHEARMYMFSAFFVTLSLFSFVKIFRDESRAGYWLLFCLTLSFLSLSDYLPNFVILIFWIFAFKKSKNLNWIIKFIASHIILVISWLWWLPVFLNQLKNGLLVSYQSPAWWETLGKFSLKNVALIPIKFIIGRVGFENDTLYGFIILVLLFVFGFLLIRGVKFLRNQKIILVWMILPVFLTTLLSFKLSVLSYFRLIFVLPAFYFLIAAGITTFKKPVKSLFLIIVLCVNTLTSGMYLFNSKFHRENWKKLVSDVRNENATVVFPGSGQKEAFNYYSSGSLKTELTGGNVNLWYLRYVPEISDPNDLKKSEIENLGYRKYQELNYNGVVVWKYKKI